MLELSDIMKKDSCVLVSETDTHSLVGRIQNGKK